MPVEINAPGSIASPSRARKHNHDHPGKQPRERSYPSHQRHLSRVVVGQSPSMSGKARAAIPRLPGSRRAKQQSGRPRQQVRRFRHGHAQIILLGLPGTLTRSVGEGFALIPSPTLRVSVV